MIQIIKKYNTLFATIVIFSISFIFYFSTIYNQYNLDDQLVTDKNEISSKGWDVFNLFLFNKDYSSKNYEIILKDRPLTIITFAVEHALIGDTPFQSHFIQIVLYALLCSILFLVLNYIFPSHKRIIFISILLFSILPIHTEVVNSIKNRDQILFMIFGALSMASIHKFSINHNWKYLLLSFILLYLSMISSSFGIVFIPLCFCLYFQNQIKYSWQTVLFAILICGISYKCYGMTMGYFTKHFSVQSNFDYFLENPLYENKDVIITISTGFYSLWMYLVKFFNPLPFNLYYGYKTFDLHYWNDAIVILSLMIHVGFIFALYYFRKNKIIFFSILIYLIHCILLSNWFKQGPGGIAERWFFFGSLGLCILLSIIINYIISKKEFSQYIFLFGSIIYFLWAWNVIQERNKNWYNLDTLISTDAKKNPQSVNVQIMNLEMSLQRYVKQGKNNKALMDSCTMLLKKLNSFNVNSFNIYHSNGYYHVLNNNFDKAEEFYKKSLNLYPENSGELRSLIHMYNASNQSEKVMPFLEEFSRNYPKIKEPYLVLTNYYLNSGMRDETLQTLNRGIENLKFGTDTLYYLAGEIYYQDKEFKNAYYYLEKIKDKYPEAMINDKLNVCKVNMN